MKTILSYLAVLTFSLILVSILDTKNIFIPKTYTKNIAAFNDSTKKIDNGIGPIKKLELGPFDKELAEKGLKLFNSKCIACHNLDKKLIGPPLRNVAKEMSPLFIMNYLLNTTEMQKKNHHLQSMVKEYNGIIMPNQNLSQRQARELLEYLRVAAIK